MCDLTVVLKVGDICINSEYPVMAKPSVGDLVVSDALVRWGFPRRMKVCAVEHDSTKTTMKLTIFLEDENEN